jgi:hypothetical protein
LPKTSPHAPTERFEVVSRLPRSYRRDTSWKNRWAVLGS